MTIKFSKMHGLGNDFMVIDAVNQHLKLSREMIQQWSDRRTGIGFDQCLIVAPSETPDVDFAYRVFNADGSEVGQCGNGARCVARFIVEHGLSENTNIRIASNSSVMSLQVNSDKTVTVELPAPILDLAKIPMRINNKDAKAFNWHQDDLGFEAVNVGNPHAVFCVSDVNVFPLAKLARALRDAKLFPQGVNVGIMQIESPSHIFLRVDERGTGETQACGSGACAAVVAGRIAHDLEKHVRVTLRGGELHIVWEGENQPIYMTGPAVTVFSGELD